MGDLRDGRDLGRGRGRAARGPPGKTAMGGNNEDKSGFHGVEVLKNSLPSHRMQKRRSGA